MRDFGVRSRTLPRGKNNSSTQPRPEMTSVRRNNEVLSTSNVQVLYGWNWFCPGYLQSVCSTLLNFPDGVSSGACVHGGYGLARRIPSQVESAQAETRSISPETLHRQTTNQSRDQIMQLKDATSAARSPSSAAAVPSLDQVLQLQDAMSTVGFAPTDTSLAPPESGASPRLFIIEPLDELAEPDMSYCCKTADVHEAAIVSVPRLRKVDANTDLLHGVRARRKVARVRPDSVLHPSISHARSMRRAEDRRCITRRADCALGRNESAASLSGRDEESEKHSSEADMNDDELSHQEFNMKVDTFISKFKRKLTMQREEPLNMY
ncbi:hypothetical protein KP509_29G008400 [Ceratopteris richardii]|uniref:Uncharacterized protein n=1 Tax=Ceratopteris richardii TaxID=49495 RepID=A0A8T2R4F2_CERRI|nr:hypothetical protein KP509_29G008400 [Ceratopteris richardii]